MPDEPEIRDIVDEMLETVETEIEFDGRGL